MVASSLTSFAAVLLLVGCATVGALRQSSPGDEGTSNLVCCCKPARPDECKHMPRVNQKGADICCKSRVGHCQTISMYKQLTDSFCDKPVDKLLREELRKLKAGLKKTKKNIEVEKEGQSANAYWIKYLRDDLEAAQRSESEQVQSDNDVVSRIHVGLGAIEVELAAIWKEVKEKAGVDELREVTQDIVGIQAELEKIEEGVGAQTEVVTDTLIHFDTELVVVRARLDEILREMQEMAGTDQVREVVADLADIGREVSKLAIRLV